MDNQIKSDDVLQMLEILQTVIIMISGVVVTIWGKSATDRNSLDRVRRATRGAYMASAALKAATTKNVEERIEEVVLSVRSEIGRKLKSKERDVSKRVIAGLSADEMYPDIIKIPKKAVEAVYETKDIAKVVKVGGGLLDKLTKKK